MSAIRVVPLTLKEANAFVAAHHRHHPPVIGAKFAIGVRDDALLRGCVIVGRPVARLLDDGFTVEVTRCCTDGAYTACSMLYGAARRAAMSMGYRRLITYTLAEEPGVSLRASGWRLVGQTSGGSWSRSRRLRTDQHPTGPKNRWEVTFA